MREKAVVLVTATGTIVAEGIMKSLRLASAAPRHPLRYAVVAADMSPQAAGLYRGDKGVLLPSPSSEDYIDSVIRRCKEESVTAVFCGAEEELPVLEANRDRIKSEAGAVLISNSAGVISLGADKWKTYEFLRERGIPCAESTLPSGWRAFLETHELPLVVKPRTSHGSIGFTIATTRSEVAGAIEQLSKAGAKPIVQELLRDEEQEYTTGVTSDLQGRILSSIAMRRKLKGGQTAKAFVEDFPEIREAAERVALAMESIGPLNVQSRLDDGESKVFEVNPRFSASCPIRAVAGVNEPDLLYRSWVLGEKTSRKRSVASKELVALRYWNEIYLPRSEYEKTVRTGTTEKGSSFTYDYF
jgi:carbamoyl-phosphate synthase large subunit